MPDFHIFYINPEYSLEGLMLKLKLWPLDAKSRLIGKDPDAGKDWGQEKGMTEDEMVGWHHQLDGHGFEQTLGGSKGQGSLVWRIHRGPKELETTERLNSNDKLGSHLWCEVRGK